MLSGSTPKVAAKPALACGIVSALTRFWIDSVGSFFWHWSDLKYCRASLFPGLGHTAGEWPMAT